MLPLLALGASSLTGSLVRFSLEEVSSYVGFSKYRSSSLVVVLLRKSCDN